MDRPNILLLFTDQQRWDTIAALGNPFIQTPALDSLAREGTAYTSTYCPSPVCIASRCSLILGQWAHRTGCVANMPMPQDRTSLMERLAAAGYQTHGVGKMHFAPDSRKLWGFESRDYSEEGAMREGDDYCEFLRANGFDHIIEPLGVRSEWYYIPQPSQLPERLHQSTWVADRALDFLGRRDPSRPFFLWASFTKPHPPFESPVPWHRLYKPVEMPFPHMPPGYETLLTFWNRVQNRYKYRDQGFDGVLVRLIRAAYYAAISFVDYNVGRILNFLREADIIDETLIIFTSDHGELLGDFGSYGKRCMLDPAARIPLLVRYPERFDAGAVCERPASSVDILPTVLRVAGVEVPEDADGVDLSELAAGDAARDGVFSQFQAGPLGCYGLIADEYKYVYSAPDGREWLFRRVPGRLEERSLAGNPAYGDVLAEMRGRLIARLRADGHDEPLDGDRWRQFPRREVPPDPDAWQLFQEGAPVDDLFPAGYRPRCRPKGGLPVQGI